MKSVTAATVLIALAACQGSDRPVASMNQTSAEQEQLDRVWTNTLVMMPQDPGLYIYRVRNLDLIEKKYAPKKKYPAVVFLHGCSGLFTSSPQVTRMVRDMAAAGYIVFAPNSLDRPHDPYCDPKTLKSYINDASKVGLRIAEAKMVRERIAAFDWIDADNVFLVGHSMGGMTTHNYNVSDNFRGYVVLGYHCGPHTDRRLEGIKTPTNRPFLSVLGDADEWFVNGPNRSINCGQYLRNHSAGKSVVLKGAPHDISAHPDGMKIVVTFLKQNTSLTQ